MDSKRYNGSIDTKEKFDHKDFVKSDPSSQGTGKRWTTTKSKFRNR